jgi:hypothetical protein
VRLGQQLFIQPGDYQIRIRQGASSAQAKWTVSAPKAYESRAPKTFKVRGKGE